LTSNYHDKLKCQFKSSDGHRETRGRTEVLILPPLLSFEQAVIGELERIAGQCDGVRYEFGGHIEKSTK
jgi:hypothetical protein